MQIIEIQVSAFAQNARLIIGEENRSFWVDPGDDAARLIELSTEHNAQIEAVLLTHGHIDHIGDAAEIAAHYDVPIIGPHINDKYWFEGLPALCKTYGLAIKPAFLPERWIEHNQIVEIAGMQWEAKFTPGHSPGHMSFLNHDAKIALVGDVIFQGSIGRTDLPGGDQARLIQSIVEEIWPLAGWRLLCGHGPETNVAAERASNPFVGDAVLADS